MMPGVGRGEAFGTMMRGDPLVDLAVRLAAKRDGEHRLSPFTTLCAIDGGDGNREFFVQATKPA